MTRRLRAIAVAIFTLSLSVGVVNAAESRSLKVYINNTLVDFTEGLGYPTIENDRILVPMRVISEYMGYDVDWNAKSKEVTVTNKDRNVGLTIGNKDAVVNNKNILMDTAAEIYKSRTYVPLRFVGENMGATVSYKDKTVILTLPDGQEVTIPTPTPQFEGMGILTGTATNDHSANLDAIRAYFGKYAQNPLAGAPAFNPIGGTLDNSFIGVTKGDTPDVQVEIRIDGWYDDYIKSTNIPTKKEYSMVNPTVKNILKFYLPNDYERVYKIVDDGFNFRWPEGTNYDNNGVDISTGADGRKVTLRDYGYVAIQIGPKK